MKFDQIILHVGPHKTGSTTIQKVCDDNRGRLQELGILYPLGHWHPQFGSFFCARPREFAYNVMEGRTDEHQIRQSDRSYMEKLTEQIGRTSCRRMLLSYEGFVGLDVSSLGAMREYLVSLSSNITVLAYARAPLSFACSEISQRAKFGLYRGPDIDLALQPQEFVLAYKHYLPKFLTIFGTENVAVRRFSRSDFPGGSIALDFLSYLGLGKDLAALLTDAAEMNLSLTAEAVLVSAAISRLDGIRRTPTEFMIRYLSLLESIKGTRITLTTNQAELILSAAKKHLDWLSQTYGIKFEPESDLVDDSPPAFSSHTVESLAREFCGLANPPA